MVSVEVWAESVGPFSMGLGCQINAGGWLKITSDKKIFQKRKLILNRGVRADEMKV